MNEIFCWDKRNSKISFLRVLLKIKRTQKNFKINNTTMRIIQRSIKRLTKSFFKLIYKYVKKTTSLSTPQWCKSQWWTFFWTKWRVKTIRKSWTLTMWSARLNSSIRGSWLALRMIWWRISKSCLMYGRLMIFPLYSICYNCWKEVRRGWQRIRVKVGIARRLYEDTKIVKYKLNYLFRQPLKRQFTQLWTCLTLSPALILPTDASPLG